MGKDVVMIDGRWSMVDDRWSTVDDRWSMVGMGKSIGNFFCSILSCLFFLFFLVLVFYYFFCFIIFFNIVLTWKFVEASKASVLYIYR